MKKNLEKKVEKKSELPGIVYVAVDSVGFLSSRREIESLYPDTPGQKRLIGVYRLTDIVEATCGVDVKCLGKKQDGR
jgi:hypothetical protein